MQVITSDTRTVMVTQSDPCAGAPVCGERAVLIQLRAASLPQVHFPLCAANMQSACWLGPACTQQALRWLHAASIPLVLCQMCVMRWLMCMYLYRRQPELQL